MDTLTPKIDNHKSFETQLNIISQVENLNDTAIKIVGYESCLSKLTKKGKKISLDIEGVFSNKTNDEISIVINNQNYVLKSHDFNVATPHDDIFSGVYGIHNYEVKGIRTSKINRNHPSKFRCYIPTNIEYLDGFRFLIENMVYSDNKSTYLAKCIRIFVEDIEYDIVQISQDNQGYYVIENIQKTTFQQFRKTYFAVQQALGFFTGLMPAGEEYIFSEEEFEYTNYVRPSLKSMYYPVHANPYRKLYNYPKEAEKYKSKLNIVPAEIVSNLVKKIIDTEELSSTIILLMEATSVKSLLIMPSVFAVIIESLSRIIVVNEKGKVFPINDKQQEQFIISELSKVIDDNSSALSHEVVLKLKRRISEINKPMVKENLTNNEKITRPFEQLNIKLSLEDIKAIEHRNDLLHGNIHLDNGERLTTEEINEYMLYVSGKLYTLLSKLILKSVNYSGFVINYARHHSKYAENEEFYDEI